MNSSSKTKDADLRSGQMHRLGIKKSIAGFFRTSLAYFFSLNIANKLMLGFIPLVVIFVPEVFAKSIIVLVSVMLKFE